MAQDNVVELGPHENMTTDQALEIVRREQPKEVVIAYEDKDGNVLVRSNHMSRAEALFILEKAKLHAMGVI